MNSDSSLRICETCKYFHQHYVKYPNGRYVECGSGHCVYPRCKLRYTETPACKHYAPKPESQPAELTD